MKSNCKRHNVYCMVNQYYEKYIPIQLTIFKENSFMNFVPEINP